MKIDLLYFEDCPSYRVAEQYLHETLAELDLSESIEMIAITNETDAQRRRFAGSPTIRFDDVDPFLQGEGDYGLECRVFQTPEGLRGWPTKAMLREALTRISKSNQGEGNMAIDPVCGMQVDEKTAKHKTEYKGDTYYFCAPGCKFTFDEKPEDYVGPNKKPFTPMMGHGKKM